MPPQTAIVLSTHGTPDSLDDVGAFLRNIRGARLTPQSLVEEVRERYRAIGGRSPLMQIVGSVAAKLEKRLGLACYATTRFWRPTAEQTVSRIVAAGARRIISLPMAPYSPEAHDANLRRAIAALGAEIDFVEAGAWCAAPGFAESLAARIEKRASERSEGARWALVLSAHSVPVRVIESGDRYRARFCATCDAVLERVNVKLRPAQTLIAWQSRGASEEAWLGPTLDEAFEACVREGCTEVLVAPIGFPGDHVEVLYDVDIEARQSAAAKGLRMLRAPSLNDDPDLIELLATFVAPLLQSG